MTKYAPKPAEPDDADRRPVEPKAEAGEAARPSPYRDARTLRRIGARGLHPDAKPLDPSAPRLPQDVVARLRTAWRRGLRPGPLPAPKPNA